LSEGKRKKLWIEFIQENVETVPEVEGVYQLLDDSEEIIVIKGTMNVRQDLVEAIETNENARFFQILMLSLSLRIPDCKDLTENGRRRREKRNLC